MGMYKISIGDIRDTCHSSSIRHAVAEFISTLIFVFVGEGSGMAINKLSSSGGVSPAEGLITASLAHGFALFVGVSVAANKSGGHLNPAVTFGAFLGGHVTLLKMILFWIAQLLGSIVACGFLKFTTGGMQTSAFALSEGVTVWNAMVFEMVMTFGLVYTVYATAIDPKNGNLGILAPLAIGLMVGANILVGGSFEGASMNPAVSFGPAVVSWTWTHQWVYWVGPLIGGGIAAVIYDKLFISVGNCTKEQISAVDF